jgi:hypothetical protein
MEWERAASGIMFYGGIALAGLAAIAAIAASVGFFVARRRLRARLDAEYGKRRQN